MTAIPLTSKDPTVTLQALLKSALQRLPDTDIARLDCEILLCSVLKRDRYFLYAHPDTPVTAHDLADFNSLVAKRATGFPVAYLTGWKEFWSLQIEVNQHALIPRPETEQLVDLALTLTVTNTKSNILDLGTGSGAIAIAIATERPDCIITATDISLPALSLAQQNADRLGLKNIRFVHSDWFSATGVQRFDLIISNPPYVESGHNGFIRGDIRHEPRVALDGGSHGLDAYRRIIPAAIASLSARGRLLLEHGHSQGKPVRQLFHHNHYLNIETKQDYAGLDRITLAERP